MKNVVVSLALVGFISGCGSSGSYDANGVSDSAQAGSAPVDSAPADSGNNTPDANIVTVSGIYNTSRSGDEAYLYISTSGAVTAYDYQGDVSGSGDNCYAVSTASNQINSSLNSGMVTYSSTTDKYTLTSDSNVLKFEYDTTNGMHNFLLDSALSSTSELNIFDSNINIKVGGAGKFQSTLVSSDIASALCN